MNSEVTLTNYSTPSTSKGQIRLVYKRNDTRNAVLLEGDGDGDGVPRYFLATSEDGVRKVKICDVERKAVVEVERRSIGKDVFKFADRYGGKGVKVSDVLRKGASTSEGQRPMILDTPEGAYSWRKIRSQHWMLCGESSSAPVAWTEYVPGSAPTWALIVDTQVESILDHILASLFYVKYESSGHNGWENLDSRVEYLSMK